MARYDRETKHYFRDVLTHLVETGQGTFYPTPGVYVIKTEDGTVAVRPHQVIDRPVQTVIDDVVEVSSPMDGYYGQERYDGEDTGPGGVVYDSAMRLAEQAVALFGGDPLAYVRRILDDEDGEYVWGLRESMEDHVRYGRPNYVDRLAKQDDLLRHFGI
jgi:hypothetical protein